MNRGRFIGIATLPVIFLGAPNLASELNDRVEPATPDAGTATPIRDADWAERWKAAAAQLAARKIAARTAAAQRSLAKPQATTHGTPDAQPTFLARPAAAEAAGQAQASRSSPAAEDPEAWAARWRAAKAALDARKTAELAAAAPPRLHARVRRARKVALASVAAAPATPVGASIDTDPADTPRLEIARMFALQPRRPRPPRRPGGDDALTDVPAAEDDPAVTPAEDAADGTDPTGELSVESEVEPTPVGPDDELVPLTDFEPFGYDRPLADRRPDKDPADFGGRNRRVPQSDFFPLPDRFRIGLPGDYVQNTRGSLLDPYNQNVLKGDYPIVDREGHHEDLFLILTLTSDTLFEARNLPVPTSVSPAEPGKFDFFENAGQQQLINQNFVATVEFFAGDTVYKPRDFELRTTLVGNINYLEVDQQQVVNIDFREGDTRFDEEFAVQELFFEKHLADLSSSYDVLALRAGIQGFNSDFRGFLFSDNLPGVRLFGNYDNNRWQYNLAYFRQVEKDTNSGLNTFNDRDQNIFLANVYRQDFGFPGYTAQLSFHYNNDHSSDELEFDRNGFLVRPAPVGTIGPNDVDVFYLGWAGDGHIGRLNVSHQFYQAFGRESDNPIAGQEVDINAQFFALELSYDVDYIRYRGSFAYASGDRDPDDSDATGFDSIFDNPNFAGGGINYYIRQPVRLTGSGVGLTQRLSLYNNLRTSKEQGQANFVNPGLFLFNLGADLELTPKVKLIGNASYLRFVNSSSMELLLQDNMIDEEIGVDVSIGMLYRPFLNNNVIINAGAAALFPGQGFEDLYTNETLYSTFVGVTLTY